MEPKTPSCSPAPLITRQGTIYSWQEALSSSCPRCGSRLRSVIASKRPSSDAAVIFDDFLERLDLGL